MTALPDPLVLAAPGGGPPPLPPPGTSAARLLTRIAACRVVEQRLLAYGTIVAECLPARARDGAPPELTVHDLLVASDDRSEALLRRCVEAVTGCSLAEVIAREVLGPAGLTDRPDGAVSAPDLVGLLNDGALLEADARRLLLGLAQPA